MHGDRWTVFDRGSWLTEHPKDFVFGGVTNFRDKFRPDVTSLLIAEPWISTLRFHYPRTDANGSVDVYSSGKVSLSVDPGSSLAFPKVTVMCLLVQFGDQYEAFVTETMQSLFPAAPVSRRTGPSPSDTEAPGWRTSPSGTAEADAWERRHRSAFESYGCHAVLAGRLSMEDLVGLDDVRDRLNDALIQPLQRRDSLLS